MVNFEWNALNGVVFLSWLLTTPFSGLAGVILAGLVLFSRSIPIDLMLLLTLTLISFIGAARKARRRHVGVTQKYYSIRIAGVLIALVGSIFYPPLMMAGLLISLPIFLWSLLFDAHFESMTIRAYLSSTVIPALTTLVVLGRIKPMVTADFGQIWDVTFVTVGLTTLLIGSVLGFLKQKTKSLVISFTQAWVGLALFLLVIDADPQVHFALSALFCFSVAGPVLWIEGKRLGHQAETLSRILLLGMPGFLSFSTLFYSIRSIAEFNVNWIWFLIVAFFFQTLGMMANHYACDGASPESATVSQGRRVWMKFGLVILVQLLCSAALYWLDLSGAK